MIDDSSQDIHEVIEPLDLTALPYDVRLLLLDLGTLLFELLCHKINNELDLLLPKLQILAWDTGLEDVGDEILHAFHRITILAST